MVFDRLIGVAARCKFIHTPQGLRINLKREVESGGAGNPPFFDGVSLWGEGYLYFPMADCLTHGKPRRRTDQTSFSARFCLPAKTQVSGITFKSIKPRNNCSPPACVETKPDFRYDRKNRRTKRSAGFYNKPVRQRSLGSRSNQKKRIRE